MQRKLAALAATAALLLSVWACAGSGFTPENIERAATPQAKLTAAKAEYGKLLVRANAYKRQPGAEPRVVAVFQEIDLRVQGYETAAQEAIDGAQGDEALAHVNLIAEAARQLRLELVRAGVLEISVEVTQ